MGTSFFENYSSVILNSTNVFKVLGWDVNWKEKNWCRCSYANNGDMQLIIIMWCGREVSV